jgi:hypothetical protein
MHHGYQTVSSAKPRANSVGSPLRALFLKAMRTAPGGWRHLTDLLHGWIVPLHALVLAIKLVNLDQFKEFPCRRRRFFAALGFRFRNCKCSLPRFGQTPKERFDCSAAWMRVTRRTGIGAGP